MKEKNRLNEIENKLNEQGAEIARLLDYVRSSGAIEKPITYNEVDQRLLTAIGTLLESALTADDCARINTLVDAFVKFRTPFTLKIPSNFLK